MGLAQITEFPNVGDLPLRPKNAFESNRKRHCPWINFAIVDQVPFKFMSI